MNAPSRQKITRRGFQSRSYPVPANVLHEAEYQLEQFRAVSWSPQIRATLRTAVYCGPGSGGDRGAYTLELVDRDTCSVITIERNVPPSS